MTMEAAGWIAIAFLMVVIVLAWRFKALEFTIKALGFEGSVRASGTEDKDQSQAGVAPAKTVLATGDGAAAVGGDAENVDIETNVGKATQADTASTEHSTGTVATGDGAIAVDGGAKGAKIKTNVTKGDVRQ